MKKLLIMCVFSTIFFFPGTYVFSDILKDLENFQKSLGDWVSHTEELSQRLSKLEDEREAREKQIAKFNEGMANIKSLITDLNAKVDKVEKMGSLEGVKDIVKSFEGTLDVFKKRFSEMAKRLEDQEVKTSVLERIYQTSQKPLETLMQSIDEQKEVINKLAERLDKQEKTLMSMEEDLKKAATAPVQSFAQSMEELNTRLSKLEAGVIVKKIEEKEAPKEIPKETPTKTPEKIEKGQEAVEVKEKVAASEVTPKEAEEPAEESSEMKGFTDIGNGFFIKNIEFKKFGSSSYISGEIMNKSGRDYSTADFKIQVYDKENIPLTSHRFSINGFKREDTKKFEEIIVGIQPEDITKYAIFFAEMPLLAHAGGNEIRLIKREPEVVTAETEEKPAQKEEGSAPGELKEFEDLGNNFYVRNVSFVSFGSSSVVAGEIKNNSEKDYNSVSFVMKVYTKNYGLFTSFDFSIRKLKSGDIKPFKEIITGIRPVDISDYEIVFKKSY